MPVEVPTVQDINRAKDNVNIRVGILEKSIYAALQEASGQLSKLDTRLTNLEQDVYPPLIRRIEALECSHSLATVEKGVKIAKEVDIANETLLDFAAWMLKHYATVRVTPRWLVAHYDADHAWHDRDESREDWD